MSSVLNVVVRFLTCDPSSARSQPNRRALRSPPLRGLLGLVLVGMAACNSLWSSFQGPNPISCVATPDICPQGQVCNAQTRLCEVPSDVRPTELSLVAGALGGAGSVDDTGAAARFNQPSGVAADGKGSLYIADFGNHTIRKVVLSTGEVTTLAGSAGTPGSDDGTAAARFNQPSGVAVDSTTGSLYVAEYGNHTIRKVVLSTGAVTTLAGSAGVSGSADGTTAARFNQPYGVAADSTTGSLYVTEYENHTIRRVVLSTGAVTTLAGSAGISGSADGTTAARFNRPYGVAADGTTGSLYVAEYGNHTIRKVMLNTGEVTTLAGSANMPPGSTDGMGAAARFMQPFGVAAGGDGSLYVADLGNHTIRKVVLSTREVTTLASSADMRGSTDGKATDARFYQPYGVATDGATGSLYVTEYGNHTIRKMVLSTGEVTTLAGSALMSGSADGTGAAARFFRPYGVAVDRTTGSLYVAEYGNHTIRKVVLSTGEVTTLAGSANMLPGSIDGTGAAARFNYPSGVATGDDGFLYVADLGNHTIRKVVLSTGEVTTLAGSARIPGSADGTAAALFNQPYGVAAGGDGSLYVAEYENHTIRKVVLSTGEVTTLAGSALMSGSADGTAAAARFNQPWSVAADRAGSLYVTEFGNHTIRRITLASATVITLAGIAGQGGVTLGTLPARLNTPAGVAVLPTGEIFITTFHENALLKVH